MADLGSALAALGEASGDIRAIWREGEERPVREAQRATTLQQSKEFLAPEAIQLRGQEREAKRVATQRTIEQEEALRKQIKDEEDYANRLSDPRQFGPFKYLSEEEKNDQIEELKNEGYLNSDLLWSNRAKEKWAKRMTIDENTFNTFTTKVLNGLKAKSAKETNKLEKMSEYDLKYKEQQKIVEDINKEISSIGRDADKKREISEESRRTINIISDLQRGEEWKSMPPVWQNAIIEAGKIGGTKGVEAAHTDYRKMLMEREKIGMKPMTAVKIGQTRTFQRGTESVGQEVIGFDKEGRPIWKDVSRGPKFKPTEVKPTDFDKKWIKAEESAKVRLKRKPTVTEVAEEYKRIFGTIGILGTLLGTEETPERPSPKF